MKTRILFLDNLRTFLIFLVIMLHAGMTYQSGFDAFWIVSDPEKSNSLALVGMYIDIFVMFTMFFISGYFVYSSLNSNSAASFLASKFKRIVIPWLLAVITLIPAYKIIFLYSRGLPQEAWYTYFHFFQRNGADLNIFSNNPVQSWLWFLPLLFGFQIIYMILKKLKVFRIKITLNNAVILTFIAGLIYSMSISTLSLKGWTHSLIFDFQTERVIPYFLVFLLGTLCNKLEVFNNAPKRKRGNIIANVVLSVSLTVFTIVAINLFYNIIVPERNFFIISEFFDKGLYYSSLIISMLSFIRVLVYMFKYNFNKTTKIIGELSKNSYQVYIIHMIVLGLIATILLSFQIPAIVKYLFLTVATFIISNIFVSAYNRLFKNKLLSKIVLLVVYFIVVMTFVVLERNRSAESNVILDKTTVVNNTPKMDLHIAVIADDLDVVRQHIKMGLDLNIAEASGGSSPLITASTFGKTDIALALIEAGTDVNYRNSEGSTPLHAAAFFCNIEIVAALIENGADKSLRNNAGSSALESVLIPFDYVKPVYDHFTETLGPLGLKLDYEKIKKQRDEIATMLQ
jgi:surface polysaccharide O-acyltransferase-like enzyme